jgi:hypothetical protein
MTGHRAQPMTVDQFCLLLECLCTTMEEVDAVSIATRATIQTRKVDVKLLILIQCPTLHAKLQSSILSSSPIIMVKCF